MHSGGDSSPGDAKAGEQHAAAQGGPKALQGSFTSAYHEFVGGFLFEGFQQFSAVVSIFFRVAPFSCAERRAQGC